MVSEAQKRAAAKYQRESTKRKALTFYKSEADILLDYQSERHCSKTRSAMLSPHAWLDYQSERHCSKTAGA